MSNAQARRLAVAGAGLAGPALPGRERGFAGVLGQLGQLQIDSVNVFERAHYLPLHSRLGQVDRARFDEWSAANAIEYWPHQAGFIPLEDWPLWQWLRDWFRNGYSGEWLAAHPDAVAWVRAELAAGPATGREIEMDQPKSRGSWWDWSDTKATLVRMWRIGELVVRKRERFERVFELAEHVPTLPSEHISAEDAKRELADRAARSLGVFTANDLADYWRTPVAEANRHARELTDLGRLEPVSVEGWHRAGKPLPAWRHTAVSLPTRGSRDALLSPFDPLIWYRPRTERLFDFHYRIEIYTPEHKRQFGYYCLPVLLGDSVAGRVDLKADRKARTLLVQAAWSEPDAPADAADRVRSLLIQAARWQGLERIEVAPRGTLSAALPKAIEL